MRRQLAALALPLLMAAAVLSPAAPAKAQNLFEPVIRVNDKAITRYEIEQRARMLTLFRAPGDPRELAREQLVEERLKMDAAEANGLTLDDAAIEDGMEQFAGRVDMNAEEFIRNLEGAGVARQSFREFVRAGVTWRELVRARFAPRVSVSEDDLERARAALTGESGVQVLLSEIVLPAPPQDRQAAQRRAARLSEIETRSGFASAARQYSAARTARQGGRLPWTPVSDLPAGLRSVVLSLAPGEVSDPLPSDGAIALFQLRDIKEEAAPSPDYAAIEYAKYYIDGGLSDRARARAAEVAAKTDTCDDLYGIAKDQPPEVLERVSRAPEEIPQEVAYELSRLDPGEVSATLTRNGGETLMLLMLCGRTPEFEGDGPSTEELTNFIRNQRLESFAQGYLEQLRAEARIIETG